jgi:hypothetical protein
VVVGALVGTDWARSKLLDADATGPCAHFSNVRPEA